MSGKAELGTLRDLHGGEFSVSDFITKLKPHEDPALYLPTPTVRSYLFDHDEFIEVQNLLNEGVSIVGTWGENESKKDSEEFQKVSSAFKDATGVDVWDVISEARDQRNAHFEDRMGF